MILQYIFTNILKTYEDTPYVVVYSESMQFESSRESVLFSYQYTHGMLMYYGISCK